MLSQAGKLKIGLIEIKKKAKVRKTNSKEVKEFKQSIRNLD
jgi:hypothetical protein